MSTNFIVSPAIPPEDEHNDKTKNTSQSNSRRRSNAIPSVEDCLRAIAALSGLIALRVLTPAQANSIRANFVAILRQHEPARQTSTAQLADESVMEIWAKHPELLDYIEVLLTPEQLEMIMRQAGRDANG
jgi:hypothetical protein